MSNRRGHLTTYHHRGRRHRYLPRDTLTLPYGREYGRQRHLNRGRNWPHGRNMLRHQQTCPDNQQELPTQRGNGSNVKTLLNIIIKELQPLNAVKGSHLAQIIKPSLYVPSRIRTDLQNLYRDKRLEVQKALNNASNLTLSAELWNSSEKAYYLTVSCHLISENWELKSYVLDTAHLLNEHTAEKAVEQLLRISN